LFEVSALALARVATVVELVRAAAVVAEVVAEGPDIGAVPGKPDNAPRCCRKAQSKGKITACLYCSGAANS